MMKERPFGVLENRAVPLLILADDTMEVELVPLGAAIRSIRVPDREGNLVDVCLGYDRLEQYRTMDACLGGIIGRCANRIGGACFLLNGKEIRLTANEGSNTLHGGNTGFHKKMWAYVGDESSVTFMLDSPDGEEGFPGNVRAEITYTLQDGALIMDCRGISDADTVVNLTGHAYFNLGGHDHGTVADHVLSVAANQYTPADAGNIPTGEILPVDGTPLDLRSGAVLGERLGDPFLTNTRGYDHNLVLSGGAELYCPATGIRLELTTTLPGMQLYTAGFLGTRTGKNGALYGPGCAVCLEPQFFPDAVHHASFASPILRAGEEYRQRIQYTFSTDGKLPLRA